MTDEPQVRRRLDVTGVVQGVGFRPFVFRLARLLHLAGSVQNTGRGVRIEIEGPAGALSTFANRLRGEAPPLARLSSVTNAEVPPEGDATFVILPSARAARGAWIPPDLGPCEACLVDQRADSGRRRAHPFISCTECGPRFSIASALPFDRALTSMASLPLCAECAREFATQGDRRFHAQTIACRGCGPQLTFAPPGDGAGDPVGAAVAVMRAGGIVAVKGVGAFHLVCNAADAAAVMTLRRRKARADKPLAVLVADLSDAGALVELSADGRAALSSAARPIVLAPQRANSGLVADVTSGVARLGVMLPPSPLHVLLAEAWGQEQPHGAPRALVMTSANRSDEPAVVDDTDAATALDGVADAWLGHNRPIVARCDDSVVIDAGTAGIVPVRLARGLCPVPLAVPYVTRPMLAVGGEFKAACCLAFDGQAVMAPHVGDMGTAATLDAMSESVDHLCRLLGVEPEIHVCDAHPGYLSSGWADAAAGGRALRVQHHHAHAASLMAEHGLTVDDRLVTVCLDGTGYGDDGAIWGGEVLDVSFLDARRLAHLAYAPLPGGDAAIRHPGRAAFAYLRHAAAPDHETLACVRALGDADRRVLTRQIETSAHVTPTSSMGRLFDVVSAVCGLAFTCSYEGQAAMLLEAQAAQAAARRAAHYTFEWGGITARRPLAVAWEPVLRAVAADVGRGLPVPHIAAAFHDAVADMIVGVAATVAPGARRLGLSGGVFQNVVLLGGVVERLRTRGITALTHGRVPPNDGGLSLGQVAVAAARVNGLEPS